MKVELIQSIKVKLIKERLTKGSLEFFCLNFNFA